MDLVQVGTFGILDTALLEAARPETWVLLAVGFGLLGITVGCINYLWSLRRAEKSLLEISDSWEKYSLDAINRWEKETIKSIDKWSERSRGSIDKIGGGLDS